MERHQVWLFLFGPGPVFLLVCFLGGETQVWLGDLRVFFFPSCASVALARSSHLVVLIERISKCIHYIPLWGFESGAKITSK